MQKDIHPATHPVVFVDTSCGAEFITNSTLTSDETREIDGVSHYVNRLEISSASHPFYTGKTILVDTARRAEKFAGRAAKQEAAATERKGKKAKREKAGIKKAAESKEQAAATENQ